MTVVAPSSSARCRASVGTDAHLLRHDTVHGPFPGKVKVADGAIDVGNGPIKVLSEADPDQLPWRDLGVDIAFEGIVTLSHGEREKPASRIFSSDRDCPRAKCSSPWRGMRSLIAEGERNG